MRRLTSDYTKPVTDLLVNRYFKKILRTTRNHYWMIMRGRYTIGYIALIKKVRGQYETEISIGEKKYWNKGYGSQAMQLLLKKSQRMKIKSLYLFVKKKNIRAIRMYQKNNFVIVRSQPKGQIIMRYAG